MIRDHSTLKNESNKTFMYIYNLESPGGWGGFGGGGRDKEEFA